PASRCLSRYATGVVIACNTPCLSPSRSSSLSTAVASPFFSHFRNFLNTRLVRGYHGEWWSEEELALLGKLTDEAVAGRAGRTVVAVRIKRTRAGLPKLDDQRRW